MKSIRSILFFSLFIFQTSSLYSQSLTRFDAPKGHHIYDYTQQEHELSFIEPANENIEKIWLKCGTLMYSEVQDLYYLLTSHIFGRFFKYKNELYSIGNFYFTNLKPGTYIPEGRIEFHDFMGRGTGSSRHYIDAKGAISNTSTYKSIKLKEFLRKYASNDQVTIADFDKEYTEVCVQPNGYFKQEGLMLAKTINTFEPENIMLSKDFYRSIKGLLTYRPDEMFQINNFIKTND